MAISRIEKLIFERSGLDSLEDAARIRNKNVNIYLGADVTGKVAVMSCASVALALRAVTGRIRVFMDPGKTVAPPWWSGTLRDKIIQEGVLYGEDERIEFGGMAKGEDIALGVGCSVRDAVSMDVSGSVSAVNEILPVATEFFVPAAVFAAASAFAKAFNGVVLGNRVYEGESWRFSMADFGVGTANDMSQCLPNGVCLGNIGLLGAGAIGSGFAYTLSLSGWSANVDIIDCDSYEEPNSETTLMLGKYEARRRRAKAEVLGELTKSNLLKTSPIVARISKIDDPILREKRSVFVCAVDNEDTRRLLDSVEAEVVLNGGVGGAAEEAGHLLFTRHLKGDPTLSKTYQSRGNVAVQSRPAPAEVADDECSRIEYEKVSLAAPFMGLGAGALLAAACANYNLSCMPSVNYLKFDLLKMQSKFQRELKK